MQFYFSLGGMVPSIGGTTITTVGLPSYSDFTALFDQFCIESVEFSILFSENYSSTNTATQGMPLIWYVPDYDSVESAGISTLQQYSNVKYKYLGASNDNVLVLNIRPRVSLMTETNGGTGTGANIPINREMWLSCSTASGAPHYGFKIAYDSMGAGSASIIGYIEVIAKYNLAFRYPR